MIHTFNKRRTVLAEYQMRRNGSCLDSTQGEVAYLEKKLADLQQLVAELVIENERLRQSCNFQSD